MSLIFPIVCFSLFAYGCYLKGRRPKMSWWRVFTPLIVMTVVYILFFAYVFYILTHALG